MNTTWHYKAWKKFRPVRDLNLIWTHDLCGTGEVLYEVS